MTAQWVPEQDDSRLPHVDGGRLWAGGVATAAIAALIAVVGIVVARGLLDVAVLAPKRSGTWGNANTATYAVAAFVFGLLATGLMHLLLLFTPQPFSFFGWILGLLTLVAVLAPFAISAELAPKVATAVINAVIGIAVWSLTAGTARRSAGLSTRRSAHRRL